MKHTTSLKKEPNTGYPKFKSKHQCRWSYTTDNNSDTVRFDGNRLKLPKVGYVKVVEHIQHEGRILTATISHERSGEYYASVLCEIEHSEPLPVTDKVIGIDLGLHDIIVCSDGERVEAPKHFRKSEQRLAKRQRAFSRTQKGSNGHEKARLKVARCHQKIKNQRNDFLQKLSTKLIKENQIICLEDSLSKALNEITSWLRVSPMLVLLSSFPCLNTRQNGMDAR